MGTAATHYRRWPLCDCVGLTGLWGLWLGRPCWPVQVILENFETAEEEKMAKQKVLFEKAPAWHPLNAPLNACIARARIHDANARHTMPYLIHSAFLRTSRHVDVCGKTE